MFTKMRENLTAVLLQHTPPIFGPSFFFSLLRLPRFWRVRGRSDRRPLLLSSAAHRYGNIGGAALLLSSDVSHGPHSSGNSQESSNTAYALAISAVVVVVFSLFNRTIS